MGSALARGHIAFVPAAATLTGCSATAALSRRVDADVTGSIAPGQELADNCYFEFVQKRNARGKTVTRRAHECDKDADHQDQTIT